MSLFRGFQRKCQAVFFMTFGITLFVFVRQFFIPMDLESAHDTSLMFQSRAEDVHAVKYDHNAPIIWVGGVPRSGTTLARVMLDAHPDIRCGEETRVIPRILGMHSQMMKGGVEQQRLEEAKITEDVLDEAMGAYILGIIAGHGEDAPRLCNKDPLVLRSMDKIRKIFPRSQFLMMVRDGRATCHSIVERKVSIRGFDFKTYRGCLRDWNKAEQAMYDLCMKAGEDVCLPVYYEQLVLHPQAQMERVLAFLDVAWSDYVIHHEQLIGKEGGVSLSKRELSTDQVKKPINTEALTKWVDSYPADVRAEMDELAPMLRRLGYDTSAYPPNYGTPDKQVQEQSKKVKAQKLLEQDKPDKGRLIFDGKQYSQRKKQIGRRRVQRDVPALGEREKMAAEDLFDGNTNVKEKRKPDNQKDYQFH